MLLGPFLRISTAVEHPGLLEAAPVIPGDNFDETIDLYKPILLVFWPCDFPEYIFLTISSTFLSSLLKIELSLLGISTSG